MTNAISVLIANTPTMLCGAMGGLLVDRGHPWFGAALLIIAYSLMHAIPRKES